MSRDLPELVVAKDAIKYIDDVYYDPDTYRTYLQSRAVPNEAIAMLRLIITDRGILPTAIANHSPPTLSDNNLHNISLSPTRLPASIEKQGNVFRHETEHFIQSAVRGDRLSLITKGVLASGMVLGAAALFGSEGFEIGEDLAASLPLSLKIAAKSAGIVLGSGFGAAGGAAMFYMAKGGFSPREIQARRAEKTKRTALPNGTLKIVFK